MPIYNFATLKFFSSISLKIKHMGMWKNVKCDLQINYFY